MARIKVGVPIALCIRPTRRRAPGLGLWGGPCQAPRRGLPFPARCQQGPVPPETAHLFFGGGEGCGCGCGFGGVLVVLHLQGGRWTGKGGGWAYIFFEFLCRLHDLGDFHFFL